MQDNNGPNLFIGKLIGNSRLEGKIISFDTKNIIIEIIKLNDKIFEKYLDLNKTYSLFRHEWWTDNLIVWEIEPESMKRCVSQFILQWEKDIGWAWDLDF